MPINGLRIQKTNPDGTYIKYHLMNGRYLGETHYNAQNQRVKYIRYTYDENDTICGIGVWYAGQSQAWEEYYFETNLQGDVIAVYTAENGTNGLPELVASYTYDAWGNILSSTGELAELNPFRYRGYYYDTETQFYYLQSRYYNPEIGRFISSDDRIAGPGGDLLGYNTFAYCFNNPMNLEDDSGNWPKWLKKVVKQVKKAVKKVVKAVDNFVDSIKSSSSLKNHVTMAHFTTSIMLVNLGKLFGRVKLSSTLTKKDKELGLLHSYTDVGNDARESAAGVNIADWIGVDIGVSSEASAFVSVQFTPWLHGKVSLGIDGVGGIIGLNTDKTSYDLDVLGGWGTILFFLAPEFIVAYAVAG